MHLKPVKITLTLPGSKSLTQRALICASLAQGQSIITAPNYGDDLQYLIKALQQLGVRIQKKSNQLIINGVAGKFCVPTKPIYVGDSGANYRFLAELVPVGTKLTGSAQLQKRLLKTAPTSQTISGKLLAGTLTKIPDKLVSKGYVAMTQAVIRDFSGRGRKYIIEPDASAATYWLTYNWITGAKITFSNWPVKSYQPDFQYAKALQQLTNGQTAFDFNTMPDSVMSLAVAAIFTKKIITIKNISQLTYKESNRLQALHYNLTKINIKNTITKNSITIYGTGGKFKHSKIKTFNDHRLAMSFGVLGLPVDKPNCVNKSYPNFWQDYKKIQEANVVLTGMRGVGKTTLGKQLAKQWGMKFVDLDQLIERKAKLPIAEIVARYGWKKFRALEHQVCKQITKLQNTVIATGGGTLMYTRNYQLLKHNYIILLTAPLTTLAKRIKQDNNIRPALSKNNTALSELKAIWDKRKETYYKIADLISPFPLNRGKGARGIEV
ncbi:MAG: shikimate kinase [Patescibacteria group bacterium]|jgi:5-enolpyruvylshikimate-3-phosphate synthase